MTSIRTADMEIELADNLWRLFNFTNLSPDFEMMRGDKVMRYTSRYGEAHGLPGNQLSSHYVRAVVVGFDTKEQIWRLGLHVSETPGQKPSWVELTHWEKGKSYEAASEAQKAGRVLAEYVGTPLKLFGVTKAPQDHKTGPLVPHKRNDIEPSSVKAMTQNIKIPLEYPGMWLGLGRSGSLLRLDKNIVTGKAGDIAPTYQNVEVDLERHVVKMLPPTGLLGTFFSTPGRQIEFDAIRNVEHRYTILETSKVRASGDDELLTEELTAHHVWEVYLTMDGESLLIARTMHVSSSDLERQRLEDIAGTKFDTNFKAAVGYYRQFEEEQQKIEHAYRFTHGVALKFAADMGKRLVETEITTELSA